MHEPVPEHAPDHPANSEPLAGVAVSVTLVPSVKLAEQVLPQSMPAGLLVTEPEPVPARDTDNVDSPGGGGTLNVADTVRACVIDTVQVPVPEQAPDQPAKVLPVAGVAVSVTLVPCVKSAVSEPHVLPQLMPDGLLVTEPLPVPLLVTVRVLGVRSNVAVTDRACVIDTVH